MGTVSLSDALLLHTTGMKWKDNSYRKLNRASARFFRCNTPGYACRLFETNKSNPECLLSVDNTDIPVGLLQSAANISTPRLAAFLEFKLKPIKANVCKNCKNEFCQDSRQDIGEPLNWGDHVS